MTVETAAVSTPENVLRAHRDALVRVDSKISYVAIPPMPQEDLRHYIQDTLTALPPAARAHLPSINILLVPYLEKSPVQVSMEPIPLDRSVPSHKLEEKGRVTLFFAIKEEEISEFHFNFYNRLAELLAANWSKEASAAFLGLVKEEFAAKVHGEIDEKSWRMKQVLQSKPVSKDSKAFRDYAKQAFIDTMTLYLHGICCDIDVETGPRQMPSRSVRKRLEVLHSIYPPPAGLAVFPEELGKLRPTSSISQSARRSPP